MHFCESSVLAGCNDPKAEDEDFRFDKSLRELKDLRSQLHYAADYCQSTYLSAPDKKVVLENTKEYVCRAVVTLVDHLGNVSANLDCCISKTREISDAELRLDCLLQRILSSEKYAHNLALTHLRWSVKMPRHHLRYISTSTATAVRMTEVGSTELKPTTSTNMTRPEHDKDAIASSTRGSVVLPVRDGLSILPKGPNPTFHFESCARKSGRRWSLQRADPNWLQGNQISRNRGLLQVAETSLSQGLQRSQSIQRSGRRKSLQGSDIISFIWKAKG